MDTSYLLIGDTGFVGSAFKRHFERFAIPFTSVNRSNYNDHKGLKAKAVINAAGNSKKYLAKNEPLHSFKMEVVSAIQSIFDFDYEKYVFISSIDVYEDFSDINKNHEDILISPLNLSDYGLHKYMAELCVQKYAESWLIVRLGGMVGEGLKKNSIFDLLHGDKLWVHPDSSYQYMSTDDVATTVMQLVKNDYENEVFNVCGDGVVTIREIAEQMLGVPLDAYEWGEKTEFYEVNIEKIMRNHYIRQTREYLREYFAKCVQPGFVSASLQ